VFLGVNGKILRGVHLYVDTLEDPQRAVLAP
jgi:hypothetical protein